MISTEPISPVRKVPWSGSRVTSAPSLDHAIALIRPPYTRAEHQAGWSALDGRPLAPGTIVAVRVDRPVVDCTSLEATIRKLRKLSPTTPVVLMLHVATEECLYLTAQAARMRVRAVVAAGQPMSDSLRRPLTERAGLGDDVLEWLMLSGVRLSPTVGSLVLQIMTLAPQHHTLTDLLEEVGVPETSARFRMQKKRLPSPSRWYQAARALHAAMLIQAEPDTCLLRHAHALGYADHSALSQLVHRSFGVRPVMIRGTLGWEWLMERWLRIRRLNPLLA
jgi:AraC-like DNA-binding protein